jgi:hypothetical protein
MKSQSENEIGKRDAAKRGETRVIVVALFCFLAGLTLGALYSRPQLITAAVAPTDGPAEVAASDNSNAQPVPAPPVVDPAAIEAVKHAIPNVTLVTVETGSQVLHKTALTEFQEALKNLQARQQQAEQEFVAAQNSQSKEREKIASEKLHALQMEQMETLKEIAAKSQAQIDALQQLKSAAR